MPRFVITFAVFALIARSLGFVAVTGTLAVIAKILQLGFLAAFVAPLIFGGTWKPAG